MAILVTGGARSGKSRFAENYAFRKSSSGIYIATCQPYDEEMKDRIDQHKRDREMDGFLWETIEEPLHVDQILNSLSMRFSKQELKSGTGIDAPTTLSDVNPSVEYTPPLVLLDCLTLWLSNWLLRYEHETDGSLKLQQEIDRLIEAVHRYPYPLVLVTNEVGDGIVPAYSLGRWFRDEAGRLNQRIAAICDRVFLVTAGIPIELKTIAFNWDDL